MKSAPDPPSHPQAADFDPFLALHDYEDPAPKKASGFRQRPREAKTWDENLAGLMEHGSPEEGRGVRKRPRPVDHNGRSRKFLESAGYAVTRLEQWRNLASGFSCKVDYLGIFDFEGLKDGKPRLLVQVCGGSGKAAHLRKMCSDSISLDNRRPRLENLRHCLSQGWNCRLLIWTRNDRGRYDPEIVKIDGALVDAVVARKRGPKG